MKTHFLRASLIALSVLLPQLLSAQWSLVRFDEYNYFTNVAAATENTAIVAGIDGMGTGSFILRTNDGGLNWDSIPLNSSGTIYSLNEIHFTDVDNGFAGGLKNSYQALLKTNDNGTTWTEVTPDPAQIDPVTAISFIDPLNGYACDETNLYRTINGGVSWTNLIPGFGIEDIQFTDMNYGYACGTTVTEAVIKKTPDGGLTWNTVFTATFPFFTGSSMQKLDVISPDIVYCSGQYTNQLFHTSNGGLTWDTLTLSMIYGIQDFDFVSATEGHVLSNMGEIFGTVDGGLTWTLEYAVAGGAYGPSIFLVSISFAGNTGYVCGSNGLIKKYTDGTTALQPAEASNTVSFYPNPVSGAESFTISGLSIGDRIEIYNQAGQLTHQKSSLQAIENMQLNLSAGVYSIIVISDKSRTRQKLVILN